MKYRIVEVSRRIGDVNDHLIIKKEVEYYIQYKKYFFKKWKCFVHPNHTSWSVPFKEMKQAEEFLFKIKNIPEYQEKIIKTITS